MSQLMPYVLSPTIVAGQSGLWGEGAAFETTTIYDGVSTSQPPVHYDRHTLGAHSLPHVESELHIRPGGRTLDSFLGAPVDSSPFYGTAYVVRLSSPNWKDVQGPAGSQKHWEVSKDELKASVRSTFGETFVPRRLLLTPDEVPQDVLGNHDSQYAFTLSADAAMWLTQGGLVTYGTSYKSTDFQPGRRERPIHRILLENGVVYELLRLAHVPAGEYFFSGQPLLLAGASECAVAPVLFPRQGAFGFSSEVPTGF